MEVYSSEFPTTKRARRMAIAVPLLIFVNTCMMLFAFFMADWELESLQQNPMIGPKPAALLKSGAITRTLVISGEYWRIFSGMFVHVGIVHLFFNMFALWRVGSEIEQEHGPLIFCVIYLFSGISGSLASALFLNSISLGASGAIFGLFASDFAYFFHFRRDMGDGKWRYFSLICLAAIIGLLLGLHPQLDNFAHLFGFIGGLIIGGAAFTQFKSTRRRRWLEKNKRSLVFCLSLSVCAVLYILTLAFVLLLVKKSPSEWCPGCWRMSCLETSWWEC